MTSCVLYSNTACPVNNQTFISTMMHLLPVENIRSTSESQFYPTPNFINRGDNQLPWCTEPQLPTVTGQYVELNFTEPVVVGLIMSGGDVIRYVKNFTFQYTMSNTGEDNFETYGTSESAQVRNPSYMPLALSFKEFVILPSTS